MKKITALFISMLLFFGTSALAATSPSHLYINNTSINSADTVVKNGKTYVSVDAVANALDTDVKTSSDGTKIDPPTTDSLATSVIQQASSCVVGIIGKFKSETGLSYVDKYGQGYAHGTGVVIKQDGEILTNAHVVNDLENIIVVMTDGSSYQATIKYIDEDVDLAVVKIDAIGLKVIDFADEKDLLPGQTVIAMGTPLSFSLRNSCSMGIISGINRGVMHDYALIQTDAAINPGNSGGPLINLKGQMVGINSNKFSGVGVEGMNFSIPIGTVKYVIDQFDKFGRIRRVTLGANFEEDWTAVVGLPSNAGLKVLGVVNSKCPLLENDILKTVNGHPVNSYVDLNEELKNYNPDDIVTLSIVRDGQPIDIKAIMIEQNK